MSDQQDYYDLLFDIMKIRARGIRPLALIKTYGCQGNVADSERIGGMLERMGFGFTDDPFSADLIICNTCAIREHAEDRVYGNVGALKNVKQRFPSTLIALCGCMMQQEHVAERIKQRFPFVNLVFGTHVIDRLPEFLFTAITGSKRVFENSAENEIISENVPVRRDGTVKAWLPIMYGCDNYCTYCIVPYVRGRERSREKSYIIDEIKGIISDGFRDITLLGQNVNSYGKNLNPPESFAKLLSEIDKLSGDFWVRFMTSHPKDCTFELIDVMAKGEKIAKHLHLPVQSGSNKILASMNRKYTKEKYLELIDYAKSKIPDLSITSDIIVGFPGETYEDFCETLEIVKNVEFTSLYTFIFSPRKGTAAEKLPDRITYGEKSKWFQELLDLQENIAAKRTASCLGKTFRVLCECVGKNGRIQGRTSGNIIVETNGSDKSDIGKFIEVKITETLNWIMIGEKVHGIA